MNPAKILYLFTFLLLSTCQLVRLPLQTRPQPQKFSLKTHNIRFNSKKAGSIPIKNYLDINYCGQVKIGAQKTEFDLILDTGSSHVWIPDASLSEAKNTFNCSESLSCKMDKSKTIPLFYGVGYVIGYEMSDQLDLGGLVISDFSMISAFALHNIQLNNYDGLIGLALGRYKQDTPTVLERLKENNLISAGTFSMYLGSEPGASGTITGELIFGGFDPKYALSEFQYINVRNEAETMFWSTDLAALGYGASMNLSTLRNVPVIFDSGTSMLVFPEEFILALAFQSGKLGAPCQYLKSEELYKCDCSAKEKLDDLVFYFGEAVLKIPASSYIYTEDEACYLSMQVLEGPIKVNNPVVLGDVFLKNFYTMYTADNHTVGFAKAAPFVKSVFPMWIVLVGSGVILLAVAAGLIGYFYKKAEKNKLDNKSSYAEWSSRHDMGITDGTDSHLEHFQY